MNSSKTIDLYLHCSKFYHRYYIMDFALAKSIFKEIRIMSKQEPKLAQTLKENLKIHLHQYYSNRHLIKNRAKKLQKDDELPKAFLRTLQEANTPNSFTGFK